MQYKHTQLRSYQKFVALCGVGLLSLSIVTAPVYALNAPDGRASLPSVPDNKPGGSKPGSGVTSGSGVQNGTTHNTGTSSRVGSSNNTAASANPQTAAEKKKEEERKAAEKKKEEERKAAEKKKAEDTAKKKAATEAQNKVKAAGALSGVADKKSNSESLKIDSSSSQNSSVSSSSAAQGGIPQGADMIGVGSGVADAAHKLGWGSNTQGFWFTSMWLPVGAGAAASLMIIGLASSAALRSKYRREEELVAMDGMGYTGQYVAPLVPELRDPEYQEENLSAYTTASSASRTQFQAQNAQEFSDRQDTSAYLNALAKNDQQCCSAAPQQNSAHQTSFENIDPGDTFIDRMRFKFGK